MKLLLTDDEPLARKRMSKLLSEYRDGIDLFEASNGLEAVELCRQIQPQVVFMDIEMPGMNGLEAASLIRQQLPNTAIIFITAYEQYALDAFDLLASGYLLKPVNREKLHTVLDKVIGQAISQTQVAHNQEPFLTSKVGSKVVRIPISHVNYIMAENKYVTVYHGLETSLVDLPLKQIEQSYPDTFTRIHRHTLVASSRIMKITKTGNITQVFLSGLTQGLEVSRRHIKALKLVLQSHD
jgi:two-component system, LytTR family, response regulator AlgR